MTYEQLLDEFDGNNTLSMAESRLERWHALQGLYEALRRENQSFFLPSQSQDEHPEIRRLAAKYAMPVWKPHLDANRWASWGLWRTARYKICYVYPYGYMVNRRTSSQALKEGPPPYLVTDLFNFVMMEGYSRDDLLDGFKSIDKFVCS